MSEYADIQEADIDESDDGYCDCPVEHDDNEVGFNVCSACGRPIE